MLSSIFVKWVSPSHKVAGMTVAGIFILRHTIVAGYYGFT